MARLVAVALACAPWHTWPSYIESPLSPGNCLLQYVGGLDIVQFHLEFLIGLPVLPAADSDQNLIKILPMESYFFLGRLVLCHFDMQPMSISECGKPRTMTNDLPAPWGNGQGYQPIKNNWLRNVTRLRSVADGNPRSRGLGLGGAGFTTGLGCELGPFKGSHLIIFGALSCPVNRQNGLVALEARGSLSALTRISPLNIHG